MSGNFEKWSKQQLNTKGVYRRFPGILGDFQKAILSNKSIFLEDERFKAVASRILPMPGQGKLPSNNNGVEWSNVLKTDYILLEYPQSYTYQYQARGITRTKSTDVVELGIQGAFFPWLYVMQAQKEDLPLIACWHEDLDWGSISNCSVWARIALKGKDISLGLPYPDYTPDEVHRSLDGVSLSPKHTMHLEPRINYTGPVMPSTLLRIRYVP